MKLKITVHGVAYEVDVEVLDPGDGFPVTSQSNRPRRTQQRSATAASPSENAQPSAPSAKPSGESDGGKVTSPIAGTVHEIKCKVGDQVESGQVLLVVEAMKMNTGIAAPTSGTIKSIPVAVGDSVRENQTLVEFE